MKQIDINCDMGESYGRYIIGHDQAIFPYITSSNIACGFHGGDPLHMERTIKEALLHDVQIGAHPGYPDLAGFGRRDMSLSAEELKAMVKYQVAAVMGMAKSLGTSVKYVKPHGALYNKAADDEPVAMVLLQAIREIDGDLKLMGLAHSMLEEVALAEDMEFIAEGFADRRYQANGRLRDRSLDNSLLEDPEEAAEQVVSIVLYKQATTLEGKKVSIDAKSICIHGDNPGVVGILKVIDQNFRQHGIVKKSF